MQYNELQDMTVLVGAVLSCLYRFAGRLQTASCSVIPAITIAYLSILCTISFTTTAGCVKKDVQI